MLHGIDVSTYQGQIDWAAVKESGSIDFAYAKATEGLYEVDDQFSRNRAVCKGRDIPFGAYHFFHPEEDGESQARHFIQSVSPQHGELIPMVDVEIDSGCDAETIITQLARFTAYCEAVLEHKVILYTDFGFWTDSVNGSDAFAGHPLWIAEYNNGVAPTLPPGFQSWIIWQHSSTGSIAGIIGDVDLDVLNPNNTLKSITL